MESVEMENDSKLSNLASNQGKYENNDNAIDEQPSDCKIPRTESSTTTTTTTKEEEAAEAAAAAAARKCDDGERIDVKVVYNKNKYDVSALSTSTVAEFKKQLQDLVGIPHAMQKLMYKGLLQDNQTLDKLGITKGAKIMLVGSTLDDVLAVSYVNKPDASDGEKASAIKEALSKQKIHRKVLDKGIPEDAMPGIKNINESLPPVPLSGMLNKHGGKVRLTFKLESDQLWLSTKERTEKLPMGSIKNVVSEPIDEHEEYHIMGLQLGPTEASRYWIYWVPAQYIEAIKNAVLGQWQMF